MSTGVCCVRGCKFSYPENNTEKVSLFVLPEGENLRKKWLENIPTNLSGLKDPKICEDHFKLEDIIRTPKVESEEAVKSSSARPLLRENAVPTIFSMIPPDIDQEKSDQGRCEDALAINNPSEAETAPSAAEQRVQGSSAAEKADSTLPHKRTATQSVDCSTPPVRSKKAKIHVTETPAITFEGTSIMIMDGQNVQEELLTLQRNQDVLLQKQNDMATSISKLEKKLDSLITIMEEISARPVEPDIPCMEVLNVLPLTEETFESFDQQLISSSSLRGQLKRILLSISGRDCKGYIGSCLRKVLTNELACKYSLTGKNKTGMEKLSFEKTMIFMVLKEASLQSFKDDKANMRDVRDAVSDWLLQAKFRIARRKNNLEAENPS